MIKGWTVFFHLEGWRETISISFAANKVELVDDYTVLVDNMRVVSEDAKIIGFEESPLERWEHSLRLVERTVDGSNEENGEQ